MDEKKLLRVQKKALISCGLNVYSTPLFIQTTDTKPDQIKNIYPQWIIQCYKP